MPTLRLFATPEELGLALTEFASEQDLVVQFDAPAKSTLSLSIAVTEARPLWLRPRAVRAPKRLTRFTGALWVVPGRLFPDERVLTISSIAGERGSVARGDLLVGRLGRRLVARDFHKSARVDNVVHGGHAIARQVLHSPAARALLDDGFVWKQDRTGNTHFSPVPVVGQTKR